MELSGAPPPRHSPGIAAILDAGAVYVFGGRGQDNDDLQDTWLLRV